jgi:hypothetical protein
MKHVISTLLARLSEAHLREASVIPWSCPVPMFGDISTSRVATLGLNPSNREFVDAVGNELRGTARRFETLRSLGLSTWRNARRGHVERILQSLLHYFSNNPYDIWFRKLDALLSGTRTSYYEATACHLDLIPYATFRKWTGLTPDQRDVLLRASENAFALILRNSPVRVLVLNGTAVVKHFEQAFDHKLERTAAPNWSLNRKTSSPVPGYAFKATIDSLAGISLKHRLLVVGFNHNIQSSFGITRETTAEIGKWIGLTSEECLAKA